MSFVRGVDDALDCDEARELYDQSREVFMGLSVTTGKKVGPRRTVLYGTGGVGKSTWAAGAPKCVFIPTEDGLDDIDPPVARFPLATSADDVRGYLRELLNEPHDYRFLVIDTIDWLELLLEREICEKDGKDILDTVGGGFGKGARFLVTNWRKMLSLLDEVRATRSMSLVLLAHAEVKKFENPGGEPYDRYQPKLRERSSALLVEWAHEVLFAHYSDRSEYSKDKQKKVGVRTGERLVYTEERDAHIAKSRLDLPETLPLIFADYLKRWPKPVKEKKKRPEPIDVPEASRPHPGEAWHTKKVDEIPEEHLDIDKALAEESE